MIERMLAAQRLFGVRQCAYCGHASHDWPCPSTIETGTKRKPASKPCPCIVGRP